MSNQQCMWITLQAKNRVQHIFMLYSTLHSKQRAQECHLHTCYLTEHIKHKNLNESLRHHSVLKSTSKCKCKKTTEILGENAQALSNCLLVPLAQLWIIKTTCLKFNHPVQCEQHQLLTVDSVQLLILLKHIRPQ